MQKVGFRSIVAVFLLFIFAPGIARGKGIGAGAAVASQVLTQAPDVARNYLNLYDDVSERFVDNGDRKSFARNVVRHMSAIGYNAACIHPISLAHRWEAKITLKPKFRSGLRKRTITYTCYMARRGKRMVVTNTGDGGFINWAYQGRVLSRNGQTVRFA